MVASPCTLLCTIDPATGWCMGCGRTPDEIAEWGGAQPARQRIILAVSADRLGKLAGPDPSS